jgi:hypothetical protein
VLRRLLKEEFREKGGVHLVMLNDDDLITLKDKMPSHKREVKEEASKVCPYQATTR